MLEGAHLDHAFVVPAFGASPYLSQCLDSIGAQTLAGSEVLIATSTPSEALVEIARRHRIAVSVNPIRAGIGNDWNYALASSAARYVTLAHQDDTYDPRYAERVLAALHRTPDALIAFSDFSEVTAGGSRPMHANLRIKHRLCERAFRGREAIRERSEKRRLLAWGNPIGCNAVTFNRRMALGFRFSESLASNLDWDAWLRLADTPGAFVRVPEPLAFRRIHGASETSALIADRRRRDEDLVMFARLWPQPIAAMIALAYRLSYRANRTREPATGSR